MLHIRCDACMYGTMLYFTRKPTYS